MTIKAEARSQKSRRQPRANAGRERSDHRADTTGCDSSLLSSVAISEMDKPSKFKVPGQG